MVAFAPVAVHRGHPHRRIQEQLPAALLVVIVRGKPVVGPRRRVASTAGDSREQDHQAPRRYDGQLRRWPRTAQPKMAVGNLTGRNFQLVKALSTADQKTVASKYLFHGEITHAPPKQSGAQELVERVSSMSLMACAHASMPGACGLTHHPTTPAASLATPQEPLGSFGRITIDATPAIDRFSI
jgi:hypothetical protein